MTTEIHARDAQAAFYFARAFRVLLVADRCQFAWKLHQEIKS
jgi:hypothetical protein